MTGSSRLGRAMLALLLLLVAAAAPAFGAGLSPEVRAEIAPTGVLRAAINYGNPVLAQRNPGGGAPLGVSADLAREIAKRLGVDIAYVEFDSAGVAFEAARQGKWDVAFLAIDPKRAEEIVFSPPYVIIEGAYLVPAASPLSAVADVDRPGIRVAVGEGSTYDLFLGRALKNATLVKAKTSPAAIQLFLDQKLEVAAGVRQPLEAYARGNSVVRVLPGGFMAINQAVATPKGRDGAARALRDFVEETKASGFVARSLAASGQTDATVAPPEAARVSR